ncbi:CCCH-type Zn-finger protein (ISS) [Aphelenchoides avenae]|nr:CCCH-type Zn-finger protein (ISS) [Aphelenchus avenae]
MDVYDGSTDEQCTVPHLRSNTDPWETYRTRHRTPACPCGGKVVNGILQCQWHGMSDDTRKAYLRDKRLRDNYKTEMCRQLRDSGYCFYGEQCRFAHHSLELRPKQRHPKYKTQLCLNYAKNGSCPYGANCQFQHRSPEHASISTKSRNTVPALFGQSYLGRSIWTEEPGMDATGNTLARAFGPDALSVRATPTRTAFARSDYRRDTYARTPESELNTYPDGDEEQGFGDRRLTTQAFCGTLTAQFGNRHDGSPSDSPPSRRMLGGGTFAQSLGAQFFPR